MGVTRGSALYAEAVVRNRFAATRLTPAQAHEVWVQSDEASAFTRPDYLTQLVDEVQWWGAERSGEILAAWPIVRAVADGEVGPPPFCYYVGPMFVRSLREDKYLRYWTAYTEIMTALIGALVQEYPRFRFSLPPSLTDIRPFEWWNFDHLGGPAFAMRPRYTARIDLSEYPDDTMLYESFARDRRRYIRQWRRTPPTVVTDVSIQRLTEMHDQALGRGGADLTAARHTALHRVIELAQSGAGATLGLIPPGADQVESAIVLLDGAADSNNVFCASIAQWRDQGLTAWCIWEGLLRARRLGHRWFDFNGANSPGRAADKHFYGARAAMYFNGSFGVEG